MGGGGELLAREIGDLDRSILRIAGAKEGGKLIAAKDGAFESLVTRRREMAG
jgi:hypothetical protein